jgi:site-specific DNA-methyltransferase (adenine-specific)
MTSCGHNSCHVQQIGNATLYLGDCREILPTLGKVDAVVTDPPYGVSGERNSKAADRGSPRKNDYDSFSDDADYVGSVAVPVIEQLVGSGVRVVLTPGNRCLTLYPSPDSFGAVYQPASVGLQPWGRADAQPILYYGKSPHAGKSLPGQRCSFVMTETAERNGHPCPKPIRFWTQLCNSASRDGETILDPFMGSGTTGVACAKLGRKFIGIEIDPGYFDIACRRIEEAYKQGDLFVAPPELPTNHPIQSGLSRPFE